MVLPIAWTSQGVSVQLRDAVGSVLQEFIDPPTAWTSAGSVPDESLPLLGSVDIYDHTEFGSRDCDALAEEIRRILPAATGEDAVFLKQVEQAARRAAADPTLHLVFNGA